MANKVYWYLCPVCGHVVHGEDDSGYTCINNHNAKPMICMGYGRKAEDLAGQLSHAIGGINPCKVSFDRFVVWAQNYILQQMVIGRFNDAVRHVIQKTTDRYI